MRIPLDKSDAVGREFIDLKPELTVAVLLTIEAGWLIARRNSNVHKGADEVPITECLRDGMRQALRNNKKWTWSKRMIVAPGTESRSQAGMTVPDGRTDIPLYLWLVYRESDEHDPHAIIECKLVAEGDARLTREYIINGIDRFCSGKYGENHARGFMAGYVRAGASGAVVEGINLFLYKNTRTDEQLSPVTLSGCSWAWTSHHKRARRTTPIDLYHAMLII